MIDPRILRRTPGRLRSRFPARVARAAGGAAAPSIYAQVTAADVNACLQALLGVGDNLTPAAGWAFDVDGVDFVGGITLAAQNGAALVPSAHGQAAQQVASGAYWATADTDALNVGTSAIAFVARVSVAELPAFGATILRKGQSAGAHYALEINSSGYVAMRAKQSGGATTAPVASVVPVDSPLWIIGGRSIIDEVLRTTTSAGDSSAAFAAAIDISTTANGFGLMSVSAAQGGCSCDVDHLLVFTGAAAENVLTRRAALVAALEAAG